MKVGKKTTTQEVSQKKSDPVEREGKSSTSPTGPGTTGLQTTKGQQKALSSETSQLHNHKGENLQLGGRENSEPPRSNPGKKGIQAYRLACLDRERQKSEDKRCPPKRRDLPAEREHKLQSQTNVARSKDDPEKTGTSHKPRWPIQSGPPLKGNVPKEKPSLSQKRRNTTLREERGDKHRDPRQRRKPGPNC